MTRALIANMMEGEQRGNDLREMRLLALQVMRLRIIDVLRRN